MKKHLFKFIAVLLAYINLTPATAQDNIIKIACIGNSITAGDGILNPASDSYPAQLQDLLGDGYNVVNYGVSGRTMLRKGDFPYWNEPQFVQSQQFNPNVVIIKLGTNDSKPHNWIYGSEYIHNLREMVSVYKNLPSKPTIYLCYPAKAHKKSWDISDEVIVNQIIPAIKTVAAENNLNIIDFHSAFTNKPSLFVYDGIHPNEKGAAMMAETVKRTLVEEKIANRSFEEENTYEDNIKGWNTTNDNGSRISGESTDGKSCYSLSASSGQTAEIWQEITNMPIGSYTLNVDVLTGSSENQNIYVSVNNSKVETVLPKNTEKWTTISLEFNISSKSDVIRIGATTDQEIKIDNFNIDYISEGLVELYKPILDEYCNSLENISTSLDGNIKETVQKTLDEIHNLSDDDKLLDKAISEVCNIIDIVKTYNYIAGYKVIFDNTIAPDSEVSKFSSAYTNTIDMISNAKELTPEINNAVNNMLHSFADYLKYAKPENNNNSIDLTFMIRNAEIASDEGWTDAFVNYGQQYPGAPDDTYLDLWNGVLNAYQNIMLPGGYYRLTAATRASTGIADVYLYMSVNDDKNIKYGHQKGNTGNTLGNGWGWTELNVYVPGDDCDIALGFYANAINAHWAGADNFKLEKIYNDNIAKGDSIDLTYYVGTSQQDWHGTGIYTSSNNMVESAGEHRTGILAYQTVTGLPNGIYSIEIQAAAFQSLSAQLVPDGTEDHTFVYANNTFEKSVPVFNRTGINDNQIETYKFDNIIVTNGKLELGIRNEKQGANRVLIQIKSLTHYGNDKETVLEALSQMILEAEKTKESLATNVLTEAIDNAKKNNMESDLSDMLIAAEELDAAVKHTKYLIVNYEDIKSVIEDVRTKAETLDDSFDKATFEKSVNEIEKQMSDGSITDKNIIINLLYTILADAAKSQSFETGADMTYAIINNSFETGDMTGWNLPFGASADTKVTQSTGNYVTNALDGQFLFNMWWQGLPIEQTIENIPTGKYTLSALYTGEDPNVSGFYIVANGIPSEKFTTETFGTFQEVSTIATVGEDGKLTIRAQGSNSEGYYMPNDFWYWYKVDNFRLTPLEKTVSVNIRSDMEWSTLILPFKSEIPSGLKVYSCSGVKDNNILDLKEETIIEANKPYIIYGIGEYTFNGYDSSVKDEYNGGLLIGGFEESTVPLNSYVLQRKGNKTAFYRVDYDHLLPIGNNQCYIKLPDDFILVESLQLPDAGVTSIEEIDDENPIVNIFSLDGILLKTNVNKEDALKGLEKGIYIINKKKIVVE